VGLKVDWWSFWKESVLISPIVTDLYGFTTLQDIASSDRAAQISLVLTCNLPDLLWSSLGSLCAHGSRIFTRSSDQVVIQLYLPIVEQRA
jgi:hypothetical protein